jgi:hypothetical protein
MLYQLSYLGIRRWRGCALAQRMPVIKPPMTDLRRHFVVEFFQRARQAVLAGEPAAEIDIGAAR